jgi:peroxiredoxin
VGKTGADFNESAVERKRRLVIIAAITALSSVAGGRLSFLSDQGSMAANLYLLACALVTAQAAERSDWLLVPRLSRGQELVYRGSYAEEAVGQGVHFTRSYRLESRVFVLDPSPRGFQVALQTVLKFRTPHSEHGGEPEPNSVRLELVQVDLQGRITADAGTLLAVPVEGPATVEYGAFVEAPSGPVGLKHSWEVLEADRPARRWRMVGTELVNGAGCLKLEGMQQSEDWDRPRADRTAWRRRDTVWLAPRLGIASKVERIIERREPAHRDPTQRSVTQYELQSDIQYPGQLFDDRRREILQAHKFNEAIAPLLIDPSQHGRQPFANILTRLAYHLDNQPPTPYRPAILQVKRRAEAAIRGESPPVVPASASSQRPAVAALNQRAPDFIVTNLLTKESTQLRLWLGKPILMVFYHSDSATAEQVLSFAQAVQDKYRQRVWVLGFAVSEDAERVKKQRQDCGLSFPIHSGNGLRHSYGVEATPKLVILDADGLVRGNYVGWGPETASTVTDELQRWVPSELGSKRE